MMDNQVLNDNTYMSRALTAIKINHITLNKSHPIHQTLSRERNKESESERERGKTVKAVSSSDGLNPEKSGTHRYPHLIRSFYMLDDDE